MKKSFTKPSEEEIETYLQSKNYLPESAKTFAEKFFNYYESCGWKVGKKPMVSWHAAIRTWELNNKNYSNAKKYSANLGPTGNKSVIAAGGDFGRL
jgi:hypothetical protein